MIDFRLYRLAWLPALAAFVTVMFSLQGVPEPVEPQIAAAAFDSDRAATNARQILKAGPERAPGSEGDDAVANLVLERFEAIEAGTVATQPFTADVDGSEADLRNLVLTLPGESDRTVLVMASRDAASGPGAPSSAAATAALIELAEVLGGTEHSKTFVLVSTAAASDGAEGARRFLDSYPGVEDVEAAVVLSQPGSAAPSPPYVLRHSTDDRSTSMQLVRTAERAIAEGSGRATGRGGLFADLSRLALPLAVGEQSVLIAEGLDAIAISSAGEQPLAPEDEGLADLSPEVLGEFGGATLATLLVLDQTAAPLEHGPDSYVEFSGSLVPGWAIAMLALSLLLPAGVAAVDGLARAARRRAGAVVAVAWAFGLALPLLAALVLVYLMSVAGLIPGPRYPFDPGRFVLGFSEALALALVAGSIVAAFALARLLHRPRAAGLDALVPALGAAAFAGAIATWLQNPYLALFLVPAAHVWLLTARQPARSRALLTLAVLAAALPVVLVVRSAAGAVGAGPWDLVLAISDGQIPTLLLLALCPLAGAQLGALALAWRRGEKPGGHLGARPQAGWGPPGEGSARGSMDLDPGTADLGSEREKPRA